MQNFSECFHIKSNTLKLFVFLFHSMCYLRAKFFSVFLSFTMKHFNLFQLSLVGIYQQKKKKKKIVKMFNLWHTIFHMRTKMSIDFLISIILLLKWSFNYFTGNRQKRREIIRCFSLVDDLVISQHFHIFEKKRFFLIDGIFSLLQEISNRKKISGEPHQFSTTLIIYSSG